MTLEQMKKDLAISSVPECFGNIYSDIESTYEAHADVILSEEYILNMLDECYALIAYKNIVLEAATKVRGNPAMRLLVCILERWVRAGGNANDESYTPPEGEGLEYDFLHLFAAIPTMRDSVKHMRDRGIPEDIVRETMGEYDFCLEICKSRLGREAFDRGRLGWIRLLIGNQIMKIGRFKYELPSKKIKGICAYKNKSGEIAVFADGIKVHHSGGVLGSAGLEDEDGSYLARVFVDEEKICGHLVINGCVQHEITELSSDEWELCLCEDDAVVSIHIPKDGSFDHETIEATYAQAEKVLGEYYPEMPFKAFFGNSWLLSPLLQDVLKPTSNILAFQKKFSVFPCQSRGKSVFSFVFSEQGIPDNYEDLAENTSLQRAVKKIYQDGGYIYEYCGFFLK